MGVESPESSAERRIAPAAAAGADPAAASVWASAGRLSTLGSRLLTACALLAAAGLRLGAAEPAVPPPVPAGFVPIPAGIYSPVLRMKDEPETVPVGAFLLQEHPVTNADFLAFVQANPKWRRSQVSPLFADTGYLGEWAGELELGPGAPADSPVVRVSWFAARAYARWKGFRLPTTAEWERAAAAGYTVEDGQTEAAYRDAVISWFTVPNLRPLPAVGRGRPNYFGVRDLHTLVWEWVDDFNTALTTGESRADTGLERDLFCGAGSVGARDTANYPAFMRAGYRSSLRASYTVPNLGFRCARSLSP
jgi:sulfatase modifying factor 1